MGAQWQGHQRGLSAAFPLSWIPVLSRGGSQVCGSGQDAPVNAAEPGVTCFQLRPLTVHSVGITGGGGRV